MTQTDQPTLAQLEGAAPFVSRHIGPGEDEVAKMLAVVGRGSLAELAAAAVPEAIQATRALSLPAAASEPAVLAELRALADRNVLVTPMIGCGYSGTHTPGVILRTVLENPAWYTAYTPYQPEISQGRLEMLLNFQTMVADLTGLDICGASLLDEATAAAEAMTLCRRQSKAAADAVFQVDPHLHPQTLAVLQTRAEPLGLTVTSEPGERPVFGVLLQDPDTHGAVRDLRPEIDAAHAAGALVAVACDLLALTLAESPGAQGADIAVGSSQRFGVPLGFGGPHAAFLAVRQQLARALPGRLVGVSVDAAGAPALRLALQTREQHIRREKATSNICTAQVLLAVLAGAYAVHHGPAGLRAIAGRTHRYAALLAAALVATGEDVRVGFDTVDVRTGRAPAVHAAALAGGVELRLVDDGRLGISTDETTTRSHLDAVVAAFGAPPADWDALDRDSDPAPLPVPRETSYLTAEVFHRHRSETAMLRYLRRLADADLALDRTMIPLGSCTMKLNATTEMEPVTWPEFAGLHPFTSPAHTAGYQQLIGDLERWLAEVTGYAAVSLQPNAGSQGELAGLLAIRGYHRSRGESHREVCLIPASAHGTNAASAVMAGMRVVVVGTTPTGDVDVADLRAKIAEHTDRLAALMVTYPSTHGVYEDTITEVCAAVHEAGGQVYVDGANLNALVGLARPGEFGADVSHLNLHKTFCIPHGGGGPGVGPVGVRAHLAPFLPGHPALGTTGAVSAAPYGSAGILPISWAYVRLMGGPGLTRATQVAVLAANYVAARLQPHYPVLYTGRGGLVAHECIVDLRQITRETGVSVDDVAKRLVDYGFHAPTMSFPVAGTLMIEPTESEDLAELDRFCEAMIAVRAEIEQVAAGVWPREDNPLHHAPHTAAFVTGEWDHAYPRELGAFPGAVRPAGKYWPPVRRVDGAHGDRNLVCSCPSPAELADG